MSAKLLVLIISLSLALGARSATPFGMYALAQQAADQRNDDRVEWLMAHGAQPIEHVATLLSDADMVIVGETHEVADNCEVVASMLEPLYTQAGLRVLATEFLPASMNERIDGVVLAPVWDRDAAIDLFRDTAWPIWGYAEYVDILEAAWAVNASRAEGQPPLRVVGIDDDWRQLETLQTEDRTARFEQATKREDAMHNATRALLEEWQDGAAIKTLVLTGWAHAIFIGSHRFAARLRAEFGQRVQHLILHHDLPNAEDGRPITGTLDELFVAYRQAATAADRSTAVAFAIAESPIDVGLDPASRHARMLGQDARLSSFIEHYAIMAPSTELRPVTWIDGFVTDRLAEAIAVCERLRWIEPGSVTTSEELDVAMRRRLAGR
ncbi:MAG: hypothetical protein AAFV77_06830 [Planctomycetota bacterium]